MTSLRHLLNRDDRTICDVIYEIQEFSKQRVYTMLDAQLEEIRMYAQRMEDKLYKYRQVLRGDEDEYLKELKKDRQKVKDEIFELQAIKLGLKREVPNAKEEAKKTETEKT